VAAQRAFVPHDDVIETLAPEGADHAFNERIVLILSFAVILVTSLISNMVTVAIFVPLGIAIAQSLQVADPVAVGVILGIGPSLDYMLPSGTTTNAIVAGSGYLRVSTMVRHGATLFVLHTLLLTFIGYPLAKWVV
jgi:solute carrier family 13 (sodium-dependent dicarboxylate transporter), member 2/3/5